MEPTTTPQQPLLNRLAAALLDEAARELSGRICTDVDLGAMGFTPAERLAISRAEWVHSGSHEDEREFITDAEIQPAGWALMYCAAAALRGEQPAP